jgi:hypothetical protein
MWPGPDRDAGCRSGCANIGARIQLDAKPLTHTERGRALRRHEAHSRGLSARFIAALVQAGGAGCTCTDMPLFASTV